MVDSKTRKVIVLENALMSCKVKEVVARCLIENLHVSDTSCLWKLYID